MATQAGVTICIVHVTATIAFGSPTVFHTLARRSIAGDTDTL